MQIVDFDPDQHIAELLARPLSEPNAASWLSSTGAPLSDTLHKLPARSPGYARALLNGNDECICIWGLSPFQGRGALWLLASKEAEPALKTFADAWPEELDQMHELYGALCAFIIASDAMCSNWLHSLGFKHWDNFSFTDAAEPSAAYFRDAPHVRT
ncbi:hypothetical protein [Rhizobium leguminosarum]